MILSLYTIPPEYPDSLIQSVEIDFTATRDTQDHYKVKIEFAHPEVHGFYIYLLVLLLYPHQSQKLNLNEYGLTQEQQQIYVNFMDNLAQHMDKDLKEGLENIGFYYSVDRLIQAPYPQPNFSLPKNTATPTGFAELPTTANVSAQDAVLIFLQGLNSKIFLKTYQQNWVRSKKNTDEWLPLPSELKDISISKTTQTTSTADGSLSHKFSIKAHFKHNQAQDAGKIAFLAYIKAHVEDNNDPQALIEACQRMVATSESPEFKHGAKQAMDALLTSLERTYHNQPELLKTIDEVRKKHSLPTPEKPTPATISTAPTQEPDANANTSKEPQASPSFWQNPPLGKGSLPAITVSG